MKKPFSFIDNRIYFYIFSVLLFILAVLSIIFFRFNLGIDFAGGSVLKIRFQNSVDKTKVEQQVKDAGFSYVQVQPSASEYFIRTKVLSESDHKKILSSLEKLGKYQELSFESVGPSVSADLRKKAIWGIALVSLGIILYVAFAFRTIPKDYSSLIFGLSAVIALLHDATITAGSFSFLGHFYKNIVVDAYFITALLTTSGYSVHDTIVVADRLRENLIKREGNIKYLADLSLWQTLARSISTSLTTLFVSLTLFLLGGESIKNFALALVIGITIGTYSSIFVAVPLIVDWHKRASH